MFVCCLSDLNLPPHFFMWLSNDSLYNLCVSECMQPTEMGLEEIESRIGSLIQSDTIALLKSAVWKERLEGW
jgi:hypothetical protein